MNPEAAQDSAEVVKRARRRAREGASGLAEARAMLEARLREDPHDYAPLDAEVELLVEHGEEELARRLLEEYILYYPESADASARLAWLDHETGRADEALAEIRATLARVPTHERARRWLIEWLNDGGRHEDAITAAREGLLALGGEDAENVAARLPLLTSIGTAQLEKGQFDEARETLKGAMALDDGYMPARRALALALSRQRRHEDAVSAISTALARRDASTETLLCAAEVLVNATRIPEAVEALRRAAVRPTKQRALQARVVDAIRRIMKPGEFAPFCLNLVEEHGAGDAFAGALLEALTEEGRREEFRRLAETVFRDPAKYHETACDALRGHDSLLDAAQVELWLPLHAPVLQQDVELWGSLGWYLYNAGRFHDVIHLLGGFAQRKGVGAWMLLPLARSLEATGEEAEGNNRLRDALAMPPDLTEPEIRTRLAFNLAMDGYAATGRLVLKGCSAQGRRFSTADDAMRAAAVEALADGERALVAADLESLLAATREKLKEFAGKRRGEPEFIMRGFEARAGDLLALAKQRDGK